MTNVQVIENRISLVKKYLKILTRYRMYSRKQIENDVDIRGAVERYLYLAAQSTIDLAEAIISLKKYRKPVTIAESFLILGQEEIITARLASKLVKMAGFRNILSHDYAEIDYGIVYSILHDELGDVENFLKIINKAISKRVA